MESSPHGAAADDPLVRRFESYLLAERNASAHTRDGYLSDLALKFASEKTKGEVVVVIAGNNPKFSRQQPETTP